MIVHGIWASSVMVGDAGGEGVKPSVNFHGDRCGAVWCNGLDVGLEFRTDSSSGKDNILRRYY